MRVRENKSFLYIFCFLIAWSLNAYSQVKAQAIISIEKNKKPSQAENQEPSPVKTQLPLQAESQSVFELSAKDYLAKKLEKLESDLPKEYPGREALRLRLAHVLGLLAEENFMKSKKQDCESCFKKSQVQAKKSLFFYNSLKTSFLNNKLAFLHTEVLFQKAYLKRILGQRTQALIELKKITQKTEIKKEWKLRAWYEIGSIEFELFYYDKALQAFHQVLKLVSEIKESSKALPQLTLDEKQLASWKFQASYYKIWSLFNLSSYQLALNEMLHLVSSYLYQQKTSSLWLNEENLALKNKLDKEFITIYSHAKITHKDLDIGYQYLTKDKKNTSQGKKYLSDLAMVLRSRGRLASSNKVWWFYLSKKNSHLEQLSAYLSIFTNQLDLKNKNLFEESSPILEKIFTLQEKSSFQTKPKRIFRKRASIKKSQHMLSQKGLSLYSSIQLKAKEFFYESDAQRSQFNQKQKNKLFNLYIKYNKLNPKDKEILFLTAQLAESLKKYKLAVSLYQEASLFFKSLYKIKDMDIKNQLKWKERFSIKQMELAELGQEKQTRLQAYYFYIQEGKTRKLKYRALYQVAYLHHKDKEFSKSQALFLRLALNDFHSSNKDLLKKAFSTKEAAQIKNLIAPLAHVKTKKASETSLRLKAAHLYLSSIAIEKGKEEKLIFVSGLFKKEFPKKQDEFVKIYNLAILNYVQTLVKDQSFSVAPVRSSQEVSIQKAWSVLQLFDSKQADKKDLELYHINQMILAKELLKLNEMESSLHFLISSKQTSPASKEVALKEQLWLTELKFEFDKLLVLLEKLNPNNSSKDHLLRLIQIVDLTDKDPSSYYENYLNRFVKVSSPKKKGGEEDTTQTITKKDELERETARMILVKLLERSSEPQKKKQILKRYEVLFKDKPNELFYWVLKIDQGEMDLAFLNHFSKKQLQNPTFLPAFLERKQNLESFQKVLSTKKREPKKVSISQIPKTIQDYSQYIKQLETQALSLLKTADWTTQVFVIGYWLTELRAFYKFVFQLPLPKGLTEQEREDYGKLLLQQMKVYSNKIKELEGKQKQLFSFDFVSSYKVALQTKVFQPYLKWEINQISQFLEGDSRKTIQTFIADVEQGVQLAQLKETKKPSFKTIELELQKHYKSLNSNPFDLKNLQLVLQLEKQRTHLARVNYLSNRIKKLKTNQ